MDVNERSGCVNILDRDCGHCFKCSKVKDKGRTCCCEKAFAAAKYTDLKSVFNRCVLFYGNRVRPFFFFLTFKKKDQEGYRSK